MADPQTALFESAPPAPASEHGRDELNLIELAFTTLGRARSRKTLRTEWMGKDHKGRSRKFYKVVTGSDEFGLPEYGSEELLIALFHKASRDEFESRGVHAVPYELLTLMGWGTDGRAYERLKRALDQLAGVYITTNALWNAENQSFSKAGFHILDDYEFAEDAESGRTTLTVNWNEKLFAIFRQSRFKRLDTAFFYALPSPVAKRLYRWLDKHLRQTGRAEIDVLHLAHVKLEVSRSKRYVSSVMQVLEPALDELEARGYCRWHLAEAQTDSGKKLVFERIEHPQAVAEEEPAALSPEERARFDALVERGLTQETARELATAHEAERVDRQVAHFDWLCERDKAPRSGGWLVAAIEKDYGLPPALAHLERKREAAAQRRDEAAARGEERRRRTDAEGERAASDRRGAALAHLATLAATERAALLAEAADRLDPFNRRRYEEDPAAPGLEALVGDLVADVLAERGVRLGTEGDRPS